MAEEKKPEADDPKVITRKIVEAEENREEGKRDPRALDDALIYMADAERDAKHKTPEDMTSPDNIAPNQLAKSNEIRRK